MNHGSQHSDPQMYPNFQVNNNTNFVYNDYNHDAGVDLEEDEISELVPQFMNIPQSHPFLWAKDVNDRYTEVQIGSLHPPEPFFVPGCDNCKSKRKSGKRPLVYTCLQCAPSVPRQLCRRCAERELATEETSLHKPNHSLRLWQPTWTWSLGSGLQAPLPTTEMEDFVTNDLDDDLRQATFRASKHFDDRAIRLFLPAPIGLCRVRIQIEIKPIKSIKRDRDVVDHIKNFFSADAWSEIVGNIGASAYPSSLPASAMPPRDPLIEPQDPPKKGELKLSDNLVIERGNTSNEPKTLEVYVQVGPQNAIELVLQDEYRKSERYRTHRFKWQLKTISITRLMGPVPSFASVGQRQLYIEKLQKRRQDENKERRDEMQNMMEHYADSKAHMPTWKRPRDIRPQARHGSQMNHSQHDQFGIPIRTARSQERASNMASNHVFNPILVEPGTRGRSTYLTPNAAIRPGRAASADYSAMLQQQPAQHEGRGRSADPASRGRSPIRNPGFEVIGHGSAGSSVASVSPRRTSMV